MEGCYLSICAVPVPVLLDGVAAAAERLYSMRSFLVSCFEKMARRIANKQRILVIVLGSKEEGGWVWRRGLGRFRL